MQTQQQGLEQTLVAELRRMNAVQGRQTFRHHLAVRFQLSQGDARLLMDLGQGDGVALQRLLNALGQQQESHLLFRTHPVAAIVLLDQGQIMQGICDGSDLQIQLIEFVTQEQLVL